MIWTGFIRSNSTLKRSEIAFRQSLVDNNTMDPQPQPVPPPPPVVPPPSPMPMRKSPPLMMIVGAVILLLIVAGGAYFLGLRTGSKSDLTITPERNEAQPQAQITQEPTPTIVVDETANWKTYTSVYEGASFKYPADWVIKTTTNQYLEGEQVTLTSPTGVKVYFLPYVTGLGGGCDAADCPVVKTSLVKPLMSTGSEVQLYLTESSYQGIKRIGIVSLMDNNQYITIPVVGEKKGFPYYLIFQNHKGDQAGFYMELGSFNNPYPQANLKDMDDATFFALPDIARSVQIISSLKYQ